VHLSRGQIVGVIYPTGARSARRVAGAEARRARASPAAARAGAHAARRVLADRRRGTEARRTT